MIEMEITLAEQVETILAGTGLPWSRRDNAWAVTPPDGVGRELLVSPAEGGLTVDAVLVEWELAAPESIQALELYLQRAEKQLRGAGCRVDGSQAKVIAEVDDVERGLADALLAVSAGCRFLAREARALLEVELARQYLSFLSPQAAQR